MIKKFTSRTLHPLKSLLLGLGMLGGGIAAQAQCLNSSEQWPTSTVTPSVCDGLTANQITTCNFAGDHAVIAVTAGQSYTFASTSSFATSYLTISTDGGATAAAYGVSPLTWVAPTTGTIKLYIHTSAACGEDTECRTTTVICGTPPSCLPPGSAAATAITANSANINWTASTSSPSLGYEYYWSTTNTAPTASTTPSGSVGAGVLTANIPSLTPATTYYAWVRANCSASDKSAWTSLGNFVTQCITMNLPFVEGFGSGTKPNCWTNSNGSNNTSANALWKFSGAADYGAATSINGRPAGSYAWVDGSDPSNIADVTLTSPVVNLTGLTVPAVSFDYFSNNTNIYPNNIFTVQVNNGSSWVTIFTDNTSLPSWREIVIPLPPGFANTNAQVRFIVDKTAAPLSNAFYNDILLDSVRFVEAPTCVPPTGVAASNITATGATISWVAPTIGPPSGYEWEIRSSGLAGSGPAGLAASGNTTVPTVTASTTALTFNTTYTVYVRSLCGSSTSSWSFASTFTTPCVVYPTPFMENFEGSTFVPGCWSQATGMLAATTTFTTPQNYWNQQNYGNASVSVGSSSNKSARLNLYSTFFQDWLITPSIDLGSTPKQLEFDVALTSYNSASASTLGVDDKLAVVISTDNGVTWSSANVLQQWGSTTPIANGAGNHIIIDLTNYSGVVKFGFYAESTVSNADNDIFIDNVQVVPIPPCQVPLTVTVNSVIATTATVTWSASSSASTIGYQWEVRTSGLPGSGPTGLVSSGSTTAPTVTATPGSLTPATVHQFYVRTNCGSNTYSGWTNATSFTTAASIPWTQPFTTTATPLDWNLGGWIIGSTRGVTGNPGNNIYTNMYSGYTSASYNTINVGVVGASHVLSFDYKFSNYSSPYNPPATGAGNIAIAVSTNNGSTYTTIGTITTGTTGWQSQTYPLSAYAGQIIRVKVTATWSSGDWDVGIDNMFIGVPPCTTPVVNLGPDVVSCVTGTGSHLLNATNILPGVSYLWDNASTSPTRTVTASGTYHVTVINGACSASDTITVTFNQNPTVSLGNDTSVCDGTSVTFNAGNTGATYLWSNAATTQSITTSTAGTYYVAVTAANNCVGQDTVILTVNDNPIVDLGNDTAICAGNVLELDATNSGATYLWDDASTSATLNIDASGTYSVTVTNSDNCTASDTISIVVNELPAIDLGNDTTLCNGVVMTLDAANAGASYEWDDASTSQTRDIDGAGLYYVTVTDTNGCASTDSVNVNVVPPPSGNINVAGGEEGNFEFSVANPQNVVSAHWDFGDEHDGAGNTIAHQYTEDGDYTVKLILINECGDSTTVERTVKVEGLSLDRIQLNQYELSLYPNPARTVLHIDVKANVSMQQVTAYNILGQLVYNNNAQNAKNHSMNISSLAAGVYTLKIETDKGTIVRKFEVLK